MTDLDAEGRALRDLLDTRSREAHGSDLNVSAFARAMHKDAAHVHKWFRGEVRPGQDSREQMVEAATALGIALTTGDIDAIYGDEPPARQLSLAEAIMAQADAIAALTLELREARLGTPSSNGSRAEQAARAGVERDRERQGAEAHDKPARSRPRPPRDSGAARARRQQE